MKDEILKDEISPEKKFFLSLSEKDKKPRQFAYFV